MAYGITEIEDRLLAMLAPLQTDLQVKTLKSYQGDLEQKEIKKMVRQFPAVYVMYNGGPYSSHGARKVETPCFSLFVCDNSLRNDAEARRGGPNNPGTYAMLEKSRDLLFGQQPFAEMQPLELLQVEPVWNGDGVSVYAAYYQSGQGHLY